jgi:sterol desaturase/sphingolipid hydroxylase (fatty acid hydroxylase superfamily)
VSWPLENEATLRLGVFASVLLLVAIWESLRPRRARRETRLWRWTGNFGILVLGTLLLRLALPMGSVAAGLDAQNNQIGLLQELALPEALRIGIAIILLDFLIYVQHWIFHKVPILWRLHQVHHADRDFDVTTALRFHPIEILMSIGIKIGAVYALGAPALAVLFFEILLNAAAMFNHGNTRLPGPVDWLLRLFIVTPDMHRVHHSTLVHETNSNYGFNLPWWDRLFGTYRAQPEAGQEHFTVGLAEYQEQRQSLWWMILLPFRSGGDRH